jgi:hypothetical protein
MLAPQTTEKTMLMFILTTLSIAFAQSPETTQPTEYAKETVIDFTGMEVEGEVVKPQMSFITSFEPAREGSLITLRTSFNMEMSQSIDNVK